MEAQNSGSRNARFAVVRDFPPGCGTLSSSSLKSSAAVTSVHSYTRDFPSGCGTNAAKTTQILPKKRLMSEKDSGLYSGSVYWRRPVAVKSKPPLGAKMVVKDPQQAKAKEETGSREKNEREKVLGMLKLFRQRREKIITTERGVKRVDSKAYMELKNERKIVNRPALMIGPVPGVEVGDTFYYRLELLIVGLHRLLQGGIDSMEYRGRKFATCIVANEGHFNKMNDPNVLIYVGEGGVLGRHEVRVPSNQKLNGGNRALLNSKEENKPVRVVRGLRLDAARPQKIVYVYDGLYGVEDCKNKKGPQGNMIFEFLLVRYSGQPPISWKNCRWGRL